MDRVKHQDSRAQIRLGICITGSSTHQLGLRDPLVMPYLIYPKGPCTQIAYTLGPMYLYREYFKANVCKANVYTI